jgi:hypothetical protein
MAELDGPLYISEFVLPESDINTPLLVLRSQLAGIQDAGTPAQYVLRSVVFDTEVARPPQASEMPMCKILDTRLVLDSESYPFTVSSGESPVSLYIWFQATDEDRDNGQVVLIRNRYINWILSKLQGTVSGVTDATGITPDGNWEFQFDEGTKIVIEKVTPFDNLGWPFPCTHPDYCVRIDLEISVYPNPSPNLD